MTAALPFYARFTSETTSQLFYFGLSNRYALPAGAYALGFLLVLGLFLVSLAMEVPVWSSLLLAAVFLLNFLRELSLQSGYLFFPDSVSDLTSSFAFSLVPVFLTALYLFLNRRKSIWRPLAIMAAWALVALALRYVGSSLTGGIFALSVQDTIRAISRGSPWALLLLLNTCLTMACAAIAAFDLVRRQLSIRSEMSALSLRNRMIMENYHTIEQSIQNMSSLRHEWKNQLTAISLMVQQEDLDGLKQFLEQMNLHLTRLLPRQYSKHFAVNAILQNAAARASELGIDFQATAPISEQLSIDEGDLCSLLMNMLDNALEAASHVPPEQRQVSFSIRNHQNVVEIRCENSYDGQLSLDASGNLQSTRPDAGQHGFGVAQMRLIASRYGGPLEIGHTRDRFMVRTTLTLP